MDNATLIGLNAQQSLRRRMDLVANNLANMNTTAFKAEVALNELAVERPSEAIDEPNDIRFTRIDAVQRDMRTGSLKLTGNPLDLALEEANAFFTVQAGGDTFYTRDGSFAMDDLSRLVTREGQVVLDNAGNEIVFDPEGGPAQISENGVIRQGQLDIGQLGIVSFDVPAALEKVGDNLWTPGDQQAAEQLTPKVRQGMLENSNVNAIIEMTRMIEISRAYTSASRLVKDTDELRKNAISTLGKSQ